MYRVFLNLFHLFYCCPFISRIGLFCNLNLIELHVFALLHCGVECPINVAGGNLWCFALGPGPVLLFLFGLVCVGRYANLAGRFAFRLLAGWCFFWSCCHRRLWVVQVWLGYPGHIFCLDALISLSSFQDRAFELYRPHSGKTKTPLGGACWFVFGF